MKKMMITLLTVVMLVGALMAFPKGNRREMGNDGAGYGKDNMAMQHHMRKGDHNMRQGMRRNRMPHKMGKGNMMQRMIFSQLDLTDSQMDKLDKIRSKYRLKNIELQGKIKVLAFKKREAIKDHKYDTAKDVVSKIAEIKKTIATNRMDNIKEQWGVLTADQKKKADKLRKEHPYQMMNRFHNDNSEKDDD